MLDKQYRQSQIKKLKRVRLQKLKVIMQKITPNIHPITNIF